MLHTVLNINCITGRKTHAENGEGERCLCDDLTENIRGYNIELIIDILLIINLPLPYG